MAYLDFNLRHSQQQQGFESDERARILVQFEHDCAPLAALGFQVTSVAGDVAAGTIPRNRLQELKEHPEVILVEGSRRLKDETDMSLPAINLLDPATMMRTIPGNGRGAIIGVIDSGFDLTHPCFRTGLGLLKPTRVLCAWDQANLREAVGSPPPAFGYGIEYAREQIDEYAAEQQIVVIKNHRLAGGHGTNVAGVAAGNGAPQLVYRGVAPEAELIFVAYRNDAPIGGSAYVLDALVYILERARHFGKPVVINLSQGDNLGAHDGTSLLERAIDYLIEHEPVLVVNSAGNEGFGDHHAQGRVAQSRDTVVPFKLLGPADDDTIDLWYGRADRLAVALRTPGGEQSRFIGAGEEAVLTFRAGARAHVYSALSHPGNGENRISVVLEKHDTWEEGDNWQLLLRGDEVSCGHFDAWADRPGDLTLINFSEAACASTVTLPGTSRSIITAGGFVARALEFTPGGAVRGDLSIGSSLGPTRDGRHKPDLTAPSHLVLAPRTRQAAGVAHSYDAVIGTSMAAPHVAGVAAMLWARNPQLTAGQVRSALLTSARTDLFTGTTPNSRWGHGKLDAREAYLASITQTGKGGTIMSQQSFEMRLELPNAAGDGVTPATVRFDFSGNQLVGVRGFRAAAPPQDAKPAAAETSDEGDSAAASAEQELLVSFVFREASGDHCWVCVEPPCPPNRPKFFPVCPIGGQGVSDGPDDAG